MANRNFFCVLLLLLTQFLSSGSSKRTLMKESHVISTTQKDITTPITTVPNLVPIISSPSSSSPSPILNPNSSPDTVSPASTLPYTTTINTPTTPNSTNSSVSPSSSSSSSSSSSGSGVSWCIASPSASQMSLQVALDYACGYGGADCSEIQPNGRCYNPSSLRDHASFAFNSYYQKNPVPNSCNFGGVAVVTSTNPSSGPCQYPSIR
ncbi:glucan endo-1,3-beta-glucosidase 12-like isoform X2 [Neltuma alba]|uniref:glucan endo-1,3-beta-glucosidase 12-like isoform X2 n=1 Tax=Neltuma alba TaxID=207710 RepID=UPI0010A42148|nr:glucan endo-1,3-beta-glucosidase 12-like isoform X2 [Prosopis alba]